MKFSLENEYFGTIFSNRECQCSGHRSQFISTNGRKKHMFFALCLRLWCWKCLCCFHFSNNRNSRAKHSKWKIIIRKMPKHTEYQKTNSITVKIEKWIAKNVRKKKFHYKSLFVRFVDLFSMFPLFVYLFILLLF